MQNIAILSTEHSISFEHITVYCFKGNRVREFKNNAGLMQMWNSLSDCIGKLKAEYPYEMKALNQKIWKNEEKQKLPFVYSKSKGLRGINPFDVTSPIIDYHSLNLAAFNCRGNDKMLSELYQNWLLPPLKETKEETKTETEEKTKNKKIASEYEWSFSFNADVKKALDKLEEYNRIKGDIDSWMHDNVRYWLDTSHEGMSIRVGRIKNELAHLKSHLTYCCYQDITIQSVQEKEMRCTRCRSRWHIDDDNQKQIFSIEANMMLNKLEDIRENYIKAKKDVPLFTKKINEFLKILPQIGFRQITSIKRRAVELAELIDYKRSNDLNSFIKKMHRFERLYKMNKFGKELPKQFLKRGSTRDIVEVLGVFYQKNLLPTDMKDVETFIKEAEEFLFRQEILLENQGVIEGERVVYKIQKYHFHFTMIREVLEVIKTKEVSLSKNKMCDILRGALSISTTEEAKLPYYGQLFHLTSEQVKVLFNGMWTIGWLCDEKNVTVTEKGEQVIDLLRQRERKLREMPNDEAKKKHMRKNETKFLKEMNGFRAMREWNQEYLSVHYRKNGLSFYRKVMKFYADVPIVMTEIANFLINNYEPNLLPIYSFYQRQKYGSEAFQQVINTVLNQQKTNQRNDE